MKIIGVIPSRYQSTRFPGKPLADINGRPMIWWVYQQVQKVREFAESYVATDSPKIYDVCKQYGINVIMTSEQHMTGTDRLGEVAMKVDADFYVNIQGDEPLIEPNTIKMIVDYKLEHPEIEIINSMTTLQPDEDVTSNTIVKVVAADNGDLIYLSRSPIPFSKKGEKVCYYKHLGLYGLSRKALQDFTKSERTRIEKIEDIEMLRFLENGYRIKIINSGSRTIGVDKPEDIERVKHAMRQRGITPESFGGYSE